MKNKIRWRKPPFLLVATINGFEAVKYSAMRLLDTIVDLITPSATALGYDIVQVSFNEAAKRRTLQIMAERSADGLMRVEDCEKLSKTISALLDVEDLISGQYALEVSSPGIDRPLTRRKDFVVYQGFDAKIELMMPIDGRKRYTGILLGLRSAEDEVGIAVDGRDYFLPFESISSAKLILTEKLIKASHAQMQLNQEARNTVGVEEKR